MIPSLALPGSDTHYVDPKRCRRPDKSGLCRRTPKSLPLFLFRYHMHDEVGRGVPGVVDSDEQKHQRDGCDHEKCALGRALQQEGGDE